MLAGIKQETSLPFLDRGTALRAPERNQLPANFINSSSINPFNNGTL